MTSALTGSPRLCASATIATARADDSPQKCARTPVCSMSARSRATPAVSAASGMPGSPRRAQTSPSCMQPRPRSHGSSEWRNTVRSKLAQYSMARRITWVSVTGRRALVNPTQPASSRASMSASRLPSSPWVSAPSGWMKASPKRQARCWIICAIAGVSITGFVSGGQQSVVMPAATAARASDSIVALYSRPGSRGRARRSTSPGQTILPAASIVRAGWKPSGALPTAATKPRSSM